MVSQVDLGGINALSIIHKCPIRKLESLFTLTHLDELDHVEAHVDAVAGVFGVGQGHARHAVVAVTQDLDPKAVVLLQNCQEELAGWPCVPYGMVLVYAAILCIN